MFSSSILLIVIQLIERVLHLLLLLVNFGYYSKPEDIQKLMGPLLDTIDSRDDTQTVHHAPKTDRLVQFASVRGKHRMSVDDAEAIADEVSFKLVQPLFFHVTVESARACRAAMAQARALSHQPRKRSDGQSEAQSA
jgi:hypothetical protein